MQRRIKIILQQGETTGSRCKSTLIILVMATGKVMVLTLLSILSSRIEVKH
jgi:hypothetical protein